ncbi:hypothetical protein AAZX31_06G256600 [Glycine max]
MQLPSWPLPFTFPLYHIFSFSMSLSGSLCVFLWIILEAAMNTYRIKDHPEDLNVLIQKASFSMFDHARFFVLYPLVKNCKIPFWNNALVFLPEATINPFWNNNALA